ncbi:hypothetical protein QQZ08_008682 [Neonectria magnoliae]|uniref:AAA+ ATPase lid domain-containing protein n=1 Tax=Neonectria magnoliae TaxID=2732573 RepID=A0ABR1HSQ1_9HYPO
MLIDEADIYMEHRQVQDIERNNIVAGFLRALEYYKGILSLTTNRVHYPKFEGEERDRLWDAFFEKSEEDRETTIRITQSAKDYVQSDHIKATVQMLREFRDYLVKL